MKYFMIFVIFIMIVSYSKRENYTITTDKDGVEIVRNLNRKSPNSKLKYNLEIIADIKNSEDERLYFKFCNYFNIC